MQKRRWIHACIAMLLLVLFLALLQSLSAAQPAQPTGWQVVGQIGGPTQAVAVQGNYAYVGVGLRLIVLDVTNPVTPTEVGSTTPFPYFVEDIAVSGTYAYVAVGGAGLRVVDVSDPANPIEVGAWDSPGYAEGVDVSGHTVYLADGPYGLRVVDASDPASPTPLGSAYDMNYAFDVAVSGDYAYIAAAGAGLLVADVSDPAHPLEVSSLDTAGYAQGVTVAGEIAYIADEWEGLQIVDVSDPADPTLISSFKTPGWAFGVAISGTQAYVADAFMGLRVLDVSIPAQPHELGGYEVAGGHAGSVAVVGSTAYVADRNSGLRVIDFSDPAHPSQVGLYSPMGNAKEISISGSYAFVGAGNSGLRIIDISQPAHPVQTGALEVGEQANYLEVVAPYTYVCAMSGGSSLLVVDISDPVQPVLMGQAQLFGACRGLDVKSDVAYIANEWGLELISLSDPLHPTRLGFLQMQDWMGSPDTTVGVAVSGTLAYVASSFAGLEIVDVSNPVSPTLVGAYNGGESFSQDVALQGSLAYIADYHGLRIVDVSDPYHPTGIGFYDTPGEVYRVAISGTMAYVADGPMGVSVVDVSNPLTPTLVGSFNTLGYSYEAAVSANRILIGDSFNGLLILEPRAGAGFAQFDRGSMAGGPPVVGVSSWQAQLPQQVGTTPRAQPQKPAGADPSSLSAGRPAQQAGSGNGEEFGANNTCVVTATADSGAGSLRDCLENAASGTQILFDPLVFPPTDPVTITLLSGLPPLGAGYVTIDASNAGVILDGSATPAGTPGLKIDSDGNIIQGLQIVNFPGDGIFLRVGKYNRVGGSRLIGAGPLGQGNLLSDNLNNGISIHGTETMSNTVLGNLVGTDVAGTTARGNQGGGGGIFLAGWCSRNVVGGMQPGERNIVSGNLSNGIAMSDHAHDNLILGNYAGTDISGSLDLGNRGHGVSMEVGAYHNRAEGNLSSGNVRAGLLADGGDYNIFVGNRVGTDASGTQAIPNDWVGVYVNASFTRIGGTGVGDGNLVSGNPGGIEVGGPGTVGNLVLGNLVGTDSGGTQPLPNTYEGVSLESGRAFFGGAMAGERNVVSGNGKGLELSSDFSYIAGNYIGADVNGSADLGNQWVGVNIAKAESTVVQGNLIAYNAAQGVWVSLFPFNTIRRNSIHSNAGPGIVLSDGGNQMLPAPVILTVTETTVSGTACPGCTVEIFSDAEDEGRLYEGTAIADAAGHFTFDKGSLLSGPYVTTTATDGQGNTSEFSAPVARLVQVYLPLVLKSH
jgi:hypothetical protein